MKKILSIIIGCVLLLSCVGCRKNYASITRQDIIEVYEAAGYSVSSRVYDSKLDSGQIAYVQADHSDGNYIYFAIFETEEEAKAYKNEYYHPVMMGLFSVIYGQPSWQHWEVYGCIVVQYDEPDFFEPFRDLLKGNEKSS